MEGIIPRDPSPAPVEERKPKAVKVEESLGTTMLNSEGKQQHNLEIKKEGQKSKKRALPEMREASDSDEEADDGAIVITGEGPARKRGRQSTDSAVEIVDLTEE